MCECASDYCYTGNAMTPIVCFCVKIIQNGEPSSGVCGGKCRAVAREPTQCILHTITRVGKNICSGFIGRERKRTAKKRSDMNRNENYLTSVYYTSIRCHGGGWVQRTDSQLEVVT